jgi:hypothetical protein
MEENNFKHIKVNSEDADEVIRVGATPAKNANEEPLDLNSEPLAKEAFSEMRSEQLYEERPAQAPSAKKQNPQYSETTLEDLESTKMSAMQKAIVAVALVAVVAFVIYFVVSLNF